MPTESEVRSALADLLAELADPRDDAHWAQWLATGPKDGSDLVRILRSPARAGIKARALLVALVPEVTLLPFTWHVHGGLTGLTKSPITQGGRPIEFERLKLDLLEFTVRVLDLVIPVALANEYVSSRFMEPYEWCLLELMARLPESGSRDRAFELYNLRDWFEEIPVEGQCSCESFQRLLWHPDVPTAYKLRADRMMQEFVTAEITGNQFSRAASEGALAKYTGVISMALGWGDRELTYDASILAGQIRYLLDLGMPGAFHLFFAPQLMVVLSIVSDTELRRRLVSGFILGRTGCDRGHSCGRLDANSTEGMELAWALRPHFAADAEVGAALDAIIARGQARFGAVDRQRLEQLARQAAVRVALANFSA
jgi:hypothetical protein